MSLCRISLPKVVCAWEKSGNGFGQRPSKDATWGQFTEEHLRLMIAIAHQAALAVEDTSYYTAMVQAERLAAMGQTIASLSHHVKNILQGVSGGNYLVEDGLRKEDLDVVKKGWASVKRNQDRISHLVMDMLRFFIFVQPMAVHFLCSNTTQSTRGKGRTVGSEGENFSHVQ